MLLSSDARLLNTYAVIHPRQDEHAAAFASWLVNGESREVIEGFTLLASQRCRCGQPAVLMASQT